MVTENPTSKINYDTDILKHSVRVTGWLPACRHRHNRMHEEKCPLKYFTFCASNAVDIFMLEKEGIIRRNQKTGHLDGVYFCEQDLEEFRKIVEFVGSEAHGFLDSFVNVACFQDDADTRGKSIYDDAEYYEEHIRRKLRRKERHTRFRNAFPFDVINLDVCGVIFPPRQQRIVSPMLRSIRNILTWQKTPSSQDGRLCNEFTLFLTSHVHPAHLNRQAVATLKQALDLNLLLYTPYSAAFANRYGYGDAAQFAHNNFAEFFAVVLPKIIVGDAHRSNWDVEYQNVFLYTRYASFRGQTRPYNIMSSVAHFKRAPAPSKVLDNPLRQRYVEEVTTILDRGPCWLDDYVQDEVKARELRKSLSEIVQFREQVLSQLR